MADHQQVVAGGAEFASLPGTRPEVLEADRIGGPVLTEVGPPAGTEEVYVGACGSGAFRHCPEPAFDPAVAGGREGVAAGEVADAD